MRFVAAPSHFGARKSRTRSTGLAFYRAAPTTMASIARAVAAATASSAALVVTVQSVRRVSTPPIRPARSAEHARQAPLREFYGTAATSSRHPPHVCNAAGFNSRRLRSSQELVGDGNAEDDEDYDPYVHGGRPNRSAIKRLIDEYKSLTKELCALPKTSVAKIQMPDELREEVLGQAEVRQLFKVPKVGTIGGCYVTDGKVARNAEVRLLRDNVVIYTGRVGSLKRFKEDVGEVKQGFECGIGIANYNDLKEGDVIEFFTTIKVAVKTL